MNKKHPRPVYERRVVCYEHTTGTRRIVTVRCWSEIEFYARLDKWNHEAILMASISPDVAGPRKVYIYATYGGPEEAIGLWDYTKEERQ